MSETLAAMVLTIGAAAMWAVMLIVPAVESAAARRRLGVIRGGWLVSESARQYFYHTTCHAPDFDRYRENLKSRRHGHGF